MAWATSQTPDRIWRRFLTGKSLGTGPRIDESLAPGVERIGRPGRLQDILVVAVGNQAGFSEGSATASAGRTPTVGRPSDPARPAVCDPQTTAPATAALRRRGPPWCSRGKQTGCH